jgi:hypothetical protein
MTEEPNVLDILQGGGSPEEDEAPVVKNDEEEPEERYGRPSFSEKNFEGHKEEEPPATELKQAVHKPPMSTIKHSTTSKKDSQSRSRQLYQSERGKHQRKRSMSQLSAGSRDLQDQILNDGEVPEHELLRMKASLQNQKDENMELKKKALDFETRLTGEL